MSESETERREFEIGDWTAWAEVETPHPVKITVNIGTVGFCLLLGYVLGKRSAVAETERGDTDA